jgi:hypothetical protein
MKYFREWIKKGEWINKVWEKKVNRREDIRVMYRNKIELIRIDMNWGRCVIWLRIRI